MNYTIRAVDKSLIEGAMTEPVVVELEMFKPYEFDPAFFTDEGVAGAGHITIGDNKCYVVRPTEFGFVVKKIYTNDPDEPDPVLRSWGMYREYSSFNDKDVRLMGWLISTVKLLYPSYKDAQNLRKYKSYNLNYRLGAFAPRRSERFHPKITLWQTQEHRDIDRLTAMKPTRAFGLLFPELDHKQLMQLNDMYLQEFAPREFKVHVSTDAEDFKRAYVGDQSGTENIDTTRTRKHSAHSCMRYEFEHLPCHPVTAYATGDFSVIFVTDQTGGIAGRCVVCTSYDPAVPQAGPIYGVSEQALDCIQERLESMGAKCDDDSSWLGARLKRIEYGSDEGFVGPYLDLIPQRLSDTGEYLVISEDGEIDASVYSGLLGSSYAECYECGSNLDEDEVQHSEYDSECYCESCYYDAHFYCEYAESDVHKSESIECRRTTHGNHTEVVLVCEHHVFNGDDFVLCTDDEWWHIDDIQYCEHDDVWVSPGSIDEYFRSDWDGELYPNGMMCTTVDGEEVSKEEIEGDSGIWQKNDNDKWEQVQEEMEV